MKQNRRAPAVTPRAVEAAEQPVLAEPVVQAAVVPAAAELAAAADTLTNSCPLSLAGRDVSSAGSRLAAGAHLRAERRPASNTAS